MGFSSSKTSWLNVLKYRPQAMEDTKCCLHKDRTQRSQSTLVYGQTTLFWGVCMFAFRRDQRTTLAAQVPCFFYFLKQGLSLLQNSSNGIVWEANGPRNPLYSLHPQHWAYYYALWLPSFSWRFWGLNSGLLACQRSSLMTEGFLQPQNHTFPSITNWLRLDQPSETLM